MTYFFSTLFLVLLLPCSAQFYKSKCKVKVTQNTAHLIFKFKGGGSAVKKLKNRELCRLIGNTPIEYSLFCENDTMLIPDKGVTVDSFVQKLNGWPHSIGNALLFYECASDSRIYQYFSQDSICKNDTREVVYSDYPFYVSVFEKYNDCLKKSGIISLDMNLRSGGKYRFYVILPNYSARLSSVYFRTNWVRL
jgi:hypothetical protein